METKDILQIIKACRANGVTQFVHDKLVISFSQTEEQKTSAKIPTEIPKPVTVPPIVQERQDQLGLEADRRENLEDAEDEMAELLITEPLRYEEMLAKEELVDEPRLQH